MDALKNLVNNVPDWLRRLDELNGQIEQRQIELARLTEESSSTSDGATARAKSIRNKGSTESLKPPGEPSAHPEDTAATATEPLSEEEKKAGLACCVCCRCCRRRRSNKGRTGWATITSKSGRVTSHLRRCNGNTTRFGQQGPRRARATLRKRQRSDSVISAEGAVPKFRTRSMIIVYYDSYVQSFFEELVKFVSASRNMMRKAKMAAKVAQIKRLAELEMPDESSEEDETQRHPSNPTQTANAPAPEPNAATGPTPQSAPPPTPTPAPPAFHTLAVDTSPAAALAVTVAAAAPLEASSASQDSAIAAGEEDLRVQMRLASSRRAQPRFMAAQAAGGRGMYGRAGGAPRGPYRGAAGMAVESGQARDVYDELDKGLEYVQSMCEHAAHQFLRDGDCAEEVSNIQRRMGETKQLADKEMDRVKREDPNALRTSEDSTRGRSYRPQAMRRVVSNTTTATTAASSKEAAAAAAVAAAMSSTATTLQPPVGNGGLEVDVDVNMDLQRNSSSTPQPRPPP